MIAIDWGTTNFRAFLVGENGEVLSSRNTAAGLLNVLDKDFAGTLRLQVADWLEQGETTILLCGMVGSRYGWVEAPYVRCPAAIEDLAGALIRAPFAEANAWIVPGVETEDAEGMPEIMRGEESAALGAMAELGPEGLMCLPGTHSKWVRIEHSRMTSFCTFMTGEIFGALRQHTILSQFIRNESVENLDAFRLGVDHAGGGSGLLHELFAARTLPLKGRIEEEATGAFLSGLLIGSEVRSMIPSQPEVVLVGAKALCTLYREAITQCGGRARLLESEAVPQGLWLLQRAAQATGKDAHVTA